MVGWLVDLFRPEDPWVTRRKKLEKLQDEAKRRLLEVKSAIRFYKSGPKVEAAIRRYETVRNKIWELQGNATYTNLLETHYPL